MTHFDSTRWYDDDFAALELAWIRRLSPGYEGIVIMAACRTIDAVTPVDLGRQSPATAIHHGTIDGQGAWANEVGTVATIDGPGRLIAKCCGSQISRAKIATRKNYRVAAVTPARPSTNPGYTARCADIAATPAVVRVSLGVDFTAIGSATVAVGVTRATSDATGAGRARRCAVVARAHRAAASAIARVGTERFLTPVSGTAVAISV